MKNIITIFTVLLAIASASCQNVTAETSNTKYLRTAPNVTIGKESVFAYYQNAEFTLSYCGEITSVIDGITFTQNATVCQYEPGIWTATITGGDYVKVWVKSGVTNIEYDGEFRTFVQ